MVYSNKEAIIIDNLYVGVIIFKKGCKTSDNDAMNQAIELIQSET